MNNPRGVYISPEKKTELEAELKDRKENIRTAILVKLQYAKSLGDLSENAEYHDARERQGKNESRIREIEHVLKNAVLVQKNTDGTIGLGSKVVIQKEGSDTKREYTIVGPAEAEMAAGRLSSESPLGQALVGHTQGDKVEFESPRGVTNYQILIVE